MAKGNMLQGMARGSVGDIVFSHSKGQQVARVRNRKPVNPKSGLQMKQRSAFLCPLLFYKRGKQAQFKFAFENKGPQESDFNAFMRLNALAGIPITPAERDLDGYPCLGKYAMSRGSLSRLRFQCIPNGEDHLGIKVMFAFATKPLTLGDLSNALVAKGDYMSGDIITMFVISGGLIDGNSISEHDREWHIAQFKLDTNSDRPLSELGLTADTEGFSFPGLSGYDQSCVGVGAIISRVTDAGLKVSDCDLILSTETNRIWRYMQSDAYRNYVAAQWGATGEAILQGSLAVNSNSAAAPSIPAPQVNVTSVTIDGKNVEKGGSITLTKATPNCAIVVNGTELDGVSVTLSNNFVVHPVSATNTRIEVKTDFNYDGKSTIMKVGGTTWCTINAGQAGGGGGSQYE